MQFFTNNKKPMSFTKINNHCDFSVYPEFGKTIEVHYTIYLPKLDDSLIQYALKYDDKKFFEKLVLFPFFDIDNGNEGIVLKELEEIYKQIKLQYPEFKLHLSIEYYPHITGFIPDEEKKLLSLINKKGESYYSLTDFLAIRGASFVTDKEEFLRQLLINNIGWNDFEILFCAYKRDFEAGIAYKEEFVMKYLENIPNAIKGE
jgi:hypothetical protein